jgi:hypothetical protein
LRSDPSMGILMLFACSWAGWENRLGCWVASGEDGGQDGHLVIRAE